jgi:hypothetical protein
MRASQFKAVNLEYYVHFFSSHCSAGCSPAIRIKLAMEPSKFGWLSHS